MFWERAKHQLAPHGAGARLHTSIAPTTIDYWHITAAKARRTLTLNSQQLTERWNGARSREGRTVPFAEGGYRVKTRTCTCGADLAA
jgi:hypothetical protein